MTGAYGWRPSLGARLEGAGVRFRVWAPSARQVSVEVEERGSLPGMTAAMTATQDGHHEASVANLGAGARYRYRLDGGDALPDPASRFQPEGVHGPSEVVDATYQWTDDDWRGLDRDRVVLYEMHIGTFTPDGTYAAAAQMLPRIAELGATAVQVMPVADFAGDRNWGYDAVDLFAPARAYGRPEDLRAFVDRAHGVGLGVILDVVYNHFGPDGAYHARFSPDYFNERHQTPWGAAINLDGERSRHVRAFFVESALHWLHEYHVDGFRLDAVHALIDEGPVHFLAEYRDRLTEGRREGQPPPLLVAEEHRNLAHVVQPRDAGGFGFDLTYSDDFHHEMRRLLTGVDEGYFQDFRGSTADLALTLESGWLFQGQHSPYHGEPRGTKPAGVALPRHLHYLQNHDQVGNRAFGGRLYHEVAASTVRAATAVLLLDAATPMLFMGDEWATTTPFLYFTDHGPELGRLVREGRRSEFRAWQAFSDPRVRERIPDPQAIETFERSVLRWKEREREPHASMLRFHQALIRLRRNEPALRWTGADTPRAEALDEQCIALRREQPGEAPLLLVARLLGEGPIGEGGQRLLSPPGGMRWEVVLTTEDAPFTLTPLPIEFDGEDGVPWLHFRRPGAVVMRAVPAGAT